jgi:hypothetical protein
MRNLTATIMTILICASGIWAQDQTQTTTAPSPTLSAEAEVCTAVVDRMPSGSGVSFPAGVVSLCCWSRITGATGEVNIKHVWLYEGKTMAVVDLPIKGTPWRTYSQKKILPEWTGRWEVKVTDLAGNELKSIAFTVGDTVSTGQ